MSRRNEGLEVAIAECRAKGIGFNFEYTNNHHIKFYVEGSPMLVTISATNGNRHDTRFTRNVRSDIRRAIASCR